VDSPSARTAPSTTAHAARGSAAHRAGKAAIPPTKGTNMITLSDAQLANLLEAVRPLSPAKRILFVERVAALLAQVRDERHDAAPNT
jgi:hypothetical protein